MATFCTFRSDPSLETNWKAFYCNQDIEQPHNLQDWGCLDLAAINARNYRICGFDEIQIGWTH